LIEVIHNPESSKGDIGVMAWRQGLVSNGNRCISKPVNRSKGILTLKGGEEVKSKKSDEKLMY